MQASRSPVKTTDKPQTQARPPRGFLSGRSIRGVDPAPTVRQPSSQQAFPQAHRSIFNIIHHSNDTATALRGKGSRRRCTCALAMHRRKLQRRRAHDSLRLSRDQQEFASSQDQRSLRSQIWPQVCLTVHPPTMTRAYITQQVAFCTVKPSTHMLTQHHETPPPRSDRALPGSL